jgi:hypothetical protein
VLGFRDLSLLALKETPIVKTKVFVESHDIIPGMCLLTSDRQQHTSLVLTLNYVLFIIRYLPVHFPGLKSHKTVLSWSLSPRHGASSGCGWRNGLQLRRVAENTLNKQSRTADKGWSSSLAVGIGANKSSP